jgi:hypothetical protein
VSAPSGASGAPPAAATLAPATPLRPLLQEVYLLDLVEGLYGVYVQRLRDNPAREILAAYLRVEADRRLRIMRFLEDRAIRPGAGVRRLFAGAGSLYGRATAWLGTRIMLRIAASSSRRASRGACAALGRVASPDLLYFAGLRTRNVSDLLQDLEQRLIDTSPRGG